LSDRVRQARPSNENENADHQQCFSDLIKAQLADLFTQGIDFEVFPLKGESLSVAGSLRLIDGADGFAFAARSH
jgi:hypothetical protein